MVYTVHIHKKKHIIVELILSSLNSEYKMDDNWNRKRVVTLMCGRAFHNCIIINITNI